MIRRAGTARGATARPVVVLAGEDATDRACMRLLLEDACPEMRGRIVEISDAVRLHAASAATLAERAARLVRKARARAERERAEMACVIVHEDWDRVDGPEASHAQARVHAALNDAAGTAHYVLATWELEAWLLLFPKALRATSSAWVVPRRYAGRDTGMLDDPKRILRTECSGRGRAYRATDASTVIEHAIRLKEVGHPAASNRSWDRFRGDARRCCTDHVPTRR